MANPDKSWLTQFSKFAPFKQVNTLGDLAVSINLTTGQETSISADRKGICFGYCCVWMKKIRDNKNFSPENFGENVMSASKIQEWLKGVHSLSGVHNALILESIGTVAQMHTVPFGNHNQVKDYLDHHAENGANLIYIGLSGADWGHAIAVKLNRSSTGGYLNWSYPCALFDPNIGQGLYNNHAYLAQDLHSVIASYGTIGAIGHAIRCDAMN